jgi:energy-coupling factor transporter ATP-binding protein EcfA2
MNLQGRPLYDTAADARLFVPPREWDDLVGAVARGFNVAVVGDRGSGKSSLLRQLALHLRERGQRAAFVDVTAVEDVAEVVARVSEEAFGQRGETAALATSSTSLLRDVRGLAEVPPTVILLDGTASADALYGLFGRLRDELWQLPHRWVAAVESEEASALLRPPADVFFEMHLRLAPMEAADLETLLRLREPAFEDPLLERIAAVARGNPRAALAAGRQAATEEEGIDPFAARTERERRASLLGRPHSMLLTELEDLEAASASDEALLNRLGWTRERATQVLGDLEREGIVTSSRERQARGAPRKVYRPARKPVWE